MPKMQPAYCEEAAEDESEAIMPGTRVTAATPRPPPKEVRKPKQSPLMSDDEHEVPPRPARRERRESRAAKKDRHMSRERSYERDRERSQEHKERKRERHARRSSMHRPSKEHRNSANYQEEPEPSYSQQLTRTRSHSNRTPFNSNIPIAHPGYPGPPPSNANFYHNHPSQQMMPPPPQNMFAPPMNMGPGPGQMPGQMPGHIMGPPPMGMHPQAQMMPPQLPGPPGNYGNYPPPPLNNYNHPPTTPGPDYAEAQNIRLVQRLGPSRPMSAQAVRRDSHHHDDYLDEAPHGGQLTTRRPSMRKRDGDDERKRFAEEDKRKMPPPVGIPTRPKSARPVSGAFSRPSHPERSSHLRNRSSVCEEDDLEEFGYYRPVSPEQDDYIPSGSSRPRQGSVSYSGRPPHPRTRRPSSYYAQDPLSGSFPENYESQIGAARAYQNLTNSMKTLALTSDALQKVNRANYGGSSRSTRSGGSRGDESEWRQPSVTTHTTRSSNEEDVTIRISGGSAVVNISGRDIECQDGTELTLSSIQPMAIRSAMERPALDSAPYYSENRMTRLERVPQRNRANSQAANSFTRGSFDRRYEAPIYNYGDHY
ncbi:hypothetical protein CFO_g2230 [Ceratocystis platani]|uniref:Uncharacterized protein n=1 Tax=Ceratocystis fimbriata f. sp. platani TaxID=88771 RepID=A0A0F8BS54_CERFI|nr:hypothetical protein CFO_g2230 [Ceratocystis platani]